jgi:hypothetical protein
MLDTVDFSGETVSRYWKVLSYKIESEIFFINHDIEWKLGIAHEGPFPGRKRMVLRPRYEKNIKPSSPHLRGDLNSSMTAEELTQTLKSSLSGHIQDVTSNSLGSGWGMVEPDESADGYDVMGTVDDGSSPGTASNSNVAPTVENELGVFDTGTDGKSANLIETGPCYNGSRRYDIKDDIYEAEVLLVTSSGNHIGTLSFNTKEINFISSLHETEDAEHHLKDSSAVSITPRDGLRKRRRWTISAVSAVYLRRYRLRDTGIEIFLCRGKHRNFFVDFGSSREDVKRRDDFAKLFMQTIPSTAFKQWPTMSPYRLVNDHNIQQKWIDHEISNYEYLMALNTLSGRSFNDLCQVLHTQMFISHFTIIINLF